MEVRLNRNGWHRRLQGFVFTHPPHFYSFCPYFWVTIFCIIVTFIIPVVPIWKVIKYSGMGAGWLFTKLMDGFNDYICEPTFEWLVKNMPEDDVLKAWTVDFNDRKAWESFSHDWWDSSEGGDFLFWRDEYTTLRNMNYKEREKYNLKFQVWKKANPDWEKKIADMKIRQREFWLKRIEQRKLDEAAAIEREEKEAAERMANRKKVQAREIKKQQTFNAIIKYTKWIAYCLGVAVLVGAAYGVYWLVDMIYNAIVWYEFWPKFFYVLKWVGVILVALAVLVGFVWGLVVILAKCAISFYDIPGSRKLVKGLIWTADHIMIPFFNWLSGRVFPWIGSGFKFLWMYAVAMKENHCPEIIWEEEKSK